MKQSERSDATQSRILSVARELFGERGYDATSVEDLVTAAGMTKGAFYHHFSDKEAVFRRVHEDTVRECADAVWPLAVQATCALDRAKVGCEAFLRTCLDPRRQRILMQDAPRVLGWEEQREIEWRSTLAFQQAVFEEAVAEGRIRKRSATALAHLFFGALCEGSLYVARAPDPEAALAEVMGELNELLDALFEHGARRVS